MGIQINGATDSITAIDGTIDVVSAIGNAGVVTATAFVGNITGNVTGNINHASNLELQTGGVTRASIKSDGKLGLGVATPLATMHIEGGSSGNLIQLTNDQTGDTSSDGFVIGVNAAEAYFYHRETKHIKFGTANGERLRITSDGKLGLGVATPQASMHIEGGSNGNLLQLSNTNTGATAGDGFVIGINSLLTYVYNRENKDLTFGTNNSERLRITSTGDVAINRTSALNTAKFSLTKDADQQAIGVQLNQSSGITTSLAAYNSSGTNIFDLAHDTDSTPDLLFKLKHSSDALPVEKVRITSEGNVIIAETMAVNRPRIVLSAPNDGTNYRHLFGANLQVNSSGTFTTPTANISGGGWEYLPSNSLNAHGHIRYLSAPDTNATSSTPLERLRIDATGRVLIGVDTATNSDSYVQAFKLTGNDATITVGNVATSASGLCRYDFAPSNKVVGARIECHATEDFSTGANRTADLVFITRKDGTLSERVRIDSSGYLIAKADIRLRRTASDNGALYFGDTNNNYIFGSDADDVITFAAAGNERLRIDSAGIDVTGNITGTGTVVVSSSGNEVFKLTASS